MMKRNTRVVGPKGQVVIPKEIRERTGLREGVEVVVDTVDDQVVIKRSAPPTGTYVDYYVKTRARKLKRSVNIRNLLEEERLERARLR
ncbi:MAG: AbrB/MazE/SpoVT family DNA-binding domain-containing protein [Nitrososphaerales archaeon]